MINDISRIYYNLNQYRKPLPKKKVELKHFNNKVERNGDLFAESDSGNAEETQFEGLSDNCYKMMEEISCYVCDGDVGIHKKSGISQDLCDSWYNFCKMDEVIEIPLLERDQ